MATIVDEEINLSCARIGIEYESLSPAALDKIRPSVEAMLEEHGREYFDSEEGQQAIDVEINFNFSKYL